VNNAVQVAATGQLQTGVQFKIDDPTDIEPSVCILVLLAYVILMDMLCMRHPTAVQQLAAQCMFMCTHLIVA